MSRRPMIYRILEDPNAVCYRDSSGAVRIEARYKIQGRRWWWPFWSELNTFGQLFCEENHEWSNPLPLFRTVEDARQAIQGFKDLAEKSRHWTVIETH